ncbi:hypothetical protein BX666DRAFT_2010809 [Dichotomocladium elegans]|nr:hypothetical protein BX666DRAFT_2010809 [Dichotomocladium elegans]
MSSPATSTTSVSSIRDVGDRILSVKYSIQSIGWREEHRERLLEVVGIAHATTVHAFSFSKYIFLKSSNQPRLRHCDLLEQPFFFF